MKRYLTLILVGVLAMAFVVGAMTSSSHAVVCKEVKCWHECLAGHYYECCRYACPQGGSFVDCEYTGYMCG